MDQQPNRTFPKLNLLKEEKFEQTFLLTNLALGERCYNVTKVDLFNVTNVKNFFDI